MYSKISEFWPAFHLSLPAVCIEQIHTGKKSLRKSQPEKKIKNKGFIEMERDSTYKHKMKVFIKLHRGRVANKLSGYLPASAVMYVVTLDKTVQISSCINMGINHTEFIQRI